MSLSFNWDFLSSPEFSSFLKQELEKHVNAAIPKDFLAPIRFTEFNLGSTAPVFQVLEISDPPEMFSISKKNFRRSSTASSSSTISSSSSLLSNAPLPPSPFPAARSDDRISATMREIEDILGGGESEGGGIMIKLFLCYDGNASICISTELVVNVPAPRFVTLPVSVRISHIVFKGSMGK